MNRFKEASRPPRWVLGMYTMQKQVRKASERYLDGFRREPVEALGWVQAEFGRAGEVHGQSSCSGEDGVLTRHHVVGRLMTLESATFIGFSKCRINARSRNVD